MQGLEAEAVAATMAKLQQCIMVGARQVIPAPHVSMLELPKERVKLPQKTSGPDLQCHACASIWRKLSHNSSLPTVTFETTSEFGLKRTVTYHSASELAQGLIDALPTETWKHAADIRAAEDGGLLLTTHLQAAKQRLSGRLQCTLCGEFFNHTRGLRDHQQVKHGETYEVAVEAVSTARGALIPYAPPSTVAGALAQEWAARAAAIESGKRTLPPLLAAARDGELDTMRSLLGLIRPEDDGEQQQQEEEAMAAMAAAAANAARETTDRHGSTALHWAAGSGHTAILCFLVCELQLDVSSVGRQKDRRTPLHWAARNGHLEACTWLVEQGADPDSQTSDGTTPLHWAVWRGQLGVADYLVDEARADVHAINEYGCNAIQWAAQSDDTDGLLMCRWLKSRGLDIGKLNYNRHSALHKAAVKGNVAVCEWLLGPEVGLGREHLQPDGDGNSPSVMARLEGFSELAACLQRREDA